MLDDIIELHRRGNLHEAEAGYRELLASDPDNAEILHLLGILRGQAGDSQESVALVLRAIERDAYNATYQHTLGEMHLHAGRLAESEQAYLLAVELNPNLTSAHSGLGQVAFLRGELDNAEQHFRIALRSDEDDAQSLAGLGNIHFSRGEIRMAASHLTRAAELNPNDALIQGSLANAMLAQGTHDFAVRAANNALALKPDYAVARLVLGNALLLKGDAAGARDAFETLLAHGELLGAAQLGLGDIARLQQRFDDAIAHYDQALQQQPALHPAAIRRADALARSRRADQAITDLQARAQQYPDAAYVKVALAHLLGQRNRRRESLEVWREAAAALPDNPQVQANLALALDLAGEYDEAAALAGRVGGERPALALVRARAALGAGDGGLALQVLQSFAEQAWVERPELQRRRDKLTGLAHDALRQWPQAVEAFLRAQHARSAALPDLPELDDVLCVRLRELAAKPVLQDSSFEAPVLLVGLPGTRAGRVAALLGDQTELTVRRDRFAQSVDFVSARFDQRLLSDLGQSDLAFLQRRYTRPLQRGKPRAGAHVIDWLPYLDARVLPAMKRALPGLTLLLVQRDPRDALLNWLAFDANPKLVMDDPVAAAHWLKTALAHQQLASELIPTHVLDAETLLEDTGVDDPVASGLAAFLGLPRLTPGALVQASAHGRGGLPTSFATGHAQHYREALAAAFAVFV